MTTSPWNSRKEIIQIDLATFKIRLGFFECLKYHTFMSRQLESTFSFHSLALIEIPEQLMCLRQSGIDGFLWYVWGPFRICSSVVVHDWSSKDSDCTKPRKACQTITGWWFQTFYIFTPIWGKFSNLTDIFQMGWNHQPDKVTHKKVIPRTMSYRWPTKTITKL